jgi:hypothetical protein
MAVSAPHPDPDPDGRHVHARARMFATHHDGGALELSAELAVVRRFPLGGPHAYVMAIGEGLLFAVSGKSIEAVTIAERPHQQLTAWQQLGVVPVPGTGVSALLIVDGVLFVARAGLHQIEFVQLTAPFV